MPNASVLKRLLQVRQLLEEQSQGALKAATARLEELDEAVEQARSRQAGGRRLFAQGAASEDATDRLAGFCEAQLAQAHEENLKKAAIQAQISVRSHLAELETAYRERRKGELLLKAEDERKSAERKRRLQKDLDDLHRSHRKDIL